MTTTVIGHDLHDEKQVKVLNRIITVEESGYTYEPDVRHSELIIKELGLQAAKSVATPVAEENYENDEPLDHERFKKYQSVCARANFLATDRYDLQFASKECCRARVNLRTGTGQSSNELAATSSANRDSSSTTRSRTL